MGHQARKLHAREYSADDAKDLLMETGLLYLFTTIAQCLAAAIALLAAFALFRLQSVDNAMSAFCDQLKNSFERYGNYTDVLKLESLQAEGRYREFIETHAQLVDAWESQYPTVRKFPDAQLSAKQLKRLTANINDHKKIKAALRDALISTGIVMTGSVAATPLVHLIAFNAILAWGVAAVAVLLFIGCLWQYYLLIRAALDSR
jgi:hypothetical protein